MNTLVYTFTLTENAREVLDMVLVQQLSLNRRDHHVRGLKMKNGVKRINLPFERGTGILFVRNMMTPS